MFFGIKLTFLVVTLITFNVQCPRISDTCMFFVDFPREFILKTTGFEDKSNPYKISQWKRRGSDNSRRGPRNFTKQDIRLFYDAAHTVFCITSIFIQQVLRKFSHNINFNVLFISVHVGFTVMKYAKVTKISLSYRCKNS